MPRVLVCPRGHQWEDADSADSESVTAPCPVCGVPVKRGERPFANAGSDTAPTVVQAASWKPLPFPLFTEQAPPTLSDFEILGELGRGGMGIVYEARQRSIERVVALKVIRKDRLLDEDAVRRFRREAQAAARLRHPNIVHVLDSDHAGETHYLVMELVEGVTLQHRVDEHGPLPVERACNYIRQAALGLQHAQEQGLVHRDVKPSNLMVTPGAEQIKVLDMGVARVLQIGGPTPGESLSTLTQGGAVIGTADYIAPEQLEDAHGADIRADLYSLGCTFYFCLTGQVPFPGGSLISKLDKQRWQVPPRVNLLRPEVPTGVATVVEKLLAKKPADRYQSPAELIRILDALAETDYLGPAAPAVVLREVGRLEAHKVSVLSVRFSPNGRFFASAGKDRKVILWDAATREPITTFPAHAQEIRAVAFSPDGNQLASSSGLSVRLWDVATGQELRRLSGHAGAIRTIAFSADGQHLYSAGDDKSVRVWDLQTGRERLRYIRHTAGVACLAELPHSEQILTSGRDGMLRLWDLRSGHDVLVFHAKRGAVLDVALHGRRAASAHFDTFIRLWDLETGVVLRQLRGHRQMVCALAFAPDGRRLFSGGQDQTVRLWDVETGSELASLPCHPQGINAVAVSSDGRLALSAGSDGAIGFFELPPP